SGFAASWSARRRMRRSIWRIRRRFATGFGRSKSSRISRPSCQLARAVAESYGGVFVDDQRSDEVVGVAGVRHVDADRQDAGDAALQILDVDRRLVELLLLGVGAFLHAAFLAFVAVLLHGFCDGGGR